MIILTPFYLIGILIAKIERHVPLRYLLMLIVLITFSCEKNEPVCYDCVIKQSNIEYSAKYCCTEDEINSIIQSEAVKGTLIKCNKL